MKKIAQKIEILIRILPHFKNKKVFFFFPFYHLGGAETVHNDILTIFKDYNSLCIITNPSNNNFNKENFERSCKLIEIKKYTKKKVKAFLLKQIAKKINKTQNAIVFGCNSMFFYDLIPFLNENIKVIDLIHAFSYEEPNASEKYSITVANRINKRIVLGEKTKNDFKELYKNNNKDIQLLNRIQIIKNKVSIPKFQVEKDLSKIKVLFVGRDSYEKRPSLFFKIAKRTTNLPVEYIAIGDNFKEFRETVNLKIVGPIKEKEILADYYKMANILLITSSREGMPMVILESMAYGVIPISTDVGEINSFINQKNNNGFLIENHPNEEFIINDFIKEIEKLVSNRMILNKYSKNAYLSLQKEFSSEAFNKLYLETFL